MITTYEPLHHKYRPTSFDELVGQDPIKSTLKQALISDRIAPAYIFSGPRGTGKTSSARIFAKSLNCLKSEKATTTPCGQCELCKGISSGNALDVIEIDAASNTGVENIRELIERSRFAPAKARWKVYVIDECHMLSTAAFNALLKTLEEPPAHIKFLLATTDPKKLPITVLSRCLQFNLNKLSHEEILNHLKFIMDEEKLKFDESALSKIAEFGNGSMRDALSLLDQSISYGNGSVKEEDLKEMLGLVNHDEIINLAKLVNARDAEQILSFVKNLAHKGENLANALKDLTSIFHQISLAQIIQDKKQIDPDIASLASSFSAQDLQLYYQIAINGQKDMSLSPSEQIGLEMTLLRMIAFHPDYKEVEKKNLKPSPTENSKGKDSSIPKEPQDPPPNKKAPKADTNQLNIKSQEEWEDIIKTFDFNGAAKMLVKNTVFKSLENQTLVLTLSSDFLNLLTPKTEDSIRNGLHKEYPTVDLIFEPGETNGHSLSQKESDEREQKRKETESQFLSDDGLKELQEVFNSKVDLKSIKSIKESDNV